MLIYQVIWEVLLEIKWKKMSCVMSVSWQNESYWNHSVTRDIIHWLWEEWFSVSWVSKHPYFPCLCLFRKYKALGLCQSLAAHNLQSALCIAKQPIQVIAVRKVQLAKTWITTLDYEFKGGLCEKGIFMMMSPSLEWLAHKLTFFFTLPPTPVVSFSNLEFVPWWPIAW